MFAIAVEYLCGRAAATDPYHREQAEWPPHPDRLFMALAAAHFETDGSATERTALEWVERQGPPSIACSAAFRRDITTAFVPVNDPTLTTRTSDKSPSGAQVSAGLALLPERRSRQPRQFPVVIPWDSTVHFQWSAEMPNDIREALASLCAKVVYLGHSSSLVRLWIEDQPPPADWVATEGTAPLRLRVTGAGRLAELQSRYESGLRPSLSPSSGYKKPALPLPAKEPHTVFDDQLVIFRRVNGQRIGLESTLLLTSAARKRLMPWGPQPSPEWICGHQPDGRPSETPHLAFLPMADVGHAHARGALLGFALAIPRQISPDERNRTLQPFVASLGDEAEQSANLYLSRNAAWTIELETGDSPAKTLLSTTWTGPHYRWASVTPIVLDRFPKADGEGETIVATACMRIGLPAPADVVLMPVSPHLGAPLAQQFAPLPSKVQKGRRFQTHALIKFNEPILGPVLLGAGRYRGYGLCRPYNGGGS